MESITLTSTPTADPNATPDASVKSVGPGRVVIEAAPPATEAPAPKGETLLAGKYKSAADLEKAYVELQRKLGGKPEGAAPAAATTETPAATTAERPATETPAKAPEAGKPAVTPKSVTDAATAAGLDQAALRAEFAKNGGKFSEETYAKLAANGADRSAVDQAVDAERQRVEKFDTAMYQAVGGKDALESMFEWARANMPQNETAKIDKALQTGDEEIASLALEALKARYTAANGSEPQLVNGEATAVKGVQPFRSNEEVVAAMSDKRYKTDPAYRDDVYKRLAITTVR